MNRYVFPLVLLTIMWGFTLSSIAWSVDPLTDEVLDRIGAAGESLGVTLPEEQEDALADMELGTVAAGFSGTAWPFQHLQTRYFHHLRTVSATNEKGETTSLYILNGRGIESRPNPVPPLP